MNDITLAIDDPSRPDVVELLGQLDAFLTSLYQPEHNHLMPVAALCEPRVVFVAARCAGLPIGCGALLNHAREYGEVKRMYVAPEFRGRGIARRILTELETLAAKAGLQKVRLETGSLQTDAVRLYERAGYTPCEQFGEYPNIPLLSIFLEKRVDG